MWRCSSRRSPSPHADDAKLAESNDRFRRYTGESSSASPAPQIQRQREAAGALDLDGERGGLRARRVAEGKEAREAPALGLERVDGVIVAAAAAGVADVVRAPAHGALVPLVDDVEDERRVDADARVQRIYGGANEIMKEIIARSL